MVEELRKRKSPLNETAFTTLRNCKSTNAMDFPKLPSITSLASSHRALLTRRLRAKKLPLSPTHPPPTRLHLPPLELHCTASAFAWPSDSFSSRAKLPSTSVQVERLFSALKCMLGYMRKSMSMDMLETIVYLRLNWDLLTDEIAAESIEQAKEDDDDDECEAFLA